MSMVIPDAIEPVVGWRCFDIVDGLLVSPQQKMPWPPARKAQASCGRDHWSYEWVQRTPAQRELLEQRATEGGFTAAVGHYVKFLMPNGEVEKVTVYMPWGMKGRVPVVKHYPDKGKEWVLAVETHGHKAPNEGCSCGIHITTDLTNALGYRGQTANAAIGWVKGWGKVIPASRGFRVEFAYPEKLYLFNRPEGMTDLSHYGVPLASVLECEGFLDSIGVTWK
jgi:hypothetical protein